MPNSPGLVLALIDMLVVQSHIMWSWSTANSHNWTSCFLFSSLLACFTVWPCFSVVYCCTVSFVSGHTVVFFFFLSYIVHCNSALGPRFCANKIISYHIITTDIDQRSQNLHHIYPDMHGAQIGGIQVFPAIKITVIHQVCMYCGLNMKIDTCKMPYGGRRSCMHFVCVCLRVCGRQKPEYPQLELHGWRRHWTIPEIRGTPPKKTNIF